MINMQGGTALLPLATLFLNLTTLRTGDKVPSPTFPITTVNPKIDVATSPLSSELTTILRQAVSDRNPLPTSPSTSSQNTWPTKASSLLFGSTSSSKDMEHFFSRSTIMSLAMSALKEYAYKYATTTDTTNSMLSPTSPVLSEETKASSADSDKVDAETEMPNPSLETAMPNTEESLTDSETTMPEDKGGAGTTAMDNMNPDGTNRMVPSSDPTSMMSGETTPLNTFATSTAILKNIKPNLSTQLDQMPTTQFTGKDTVTSVDEVTMMDVEPTKKIHTTTTFKGEVESDVLASNSKLAGTTLSDPEGITTTASSVLGSANTSDKPTTMDEEKETTMPDDRVPDDLQDTVPTIPNAGSTAEGSEGPSTSRATPSLRDQLVDKKTTRKDTVEETVMTTVGQDGNDDTPETVKPTAAESESEITMPMPGDVTESDSTMATKKATSKTYYNKEIDSRPSDEFSSSSVQPSAGPSTPSTELKDVAQIENTDNNGDGKFDTEEQCVLDGSLICEEAVVCFGNGEIDCTTENEQLTGNDPKEAAALSQREDISAMEKPEVQRQLNAANRYGLKSTERAKKQLKDDVEDSTISPSSDDEDDAADSSSGVIDSSASMGRAEPASPSPNSLWDITPAARLMPRRIPETPSSLTCNMTRTLMCSPIPMLGRCKGKSKCYVTQVQYRRQLERWEIAVISVLTAVGGVVLVITVYIIYASWKKLKVRPDHSVGARPHP